MANHSLCNSVLVFGCLCCRGLDTQLKNVKVKLNRGLQCFS